MMKISIEEASERMNVSKTFLREGLARDKFPFGFSLKMSKDSKRRMFYINKELFEKYLKGEIKNEN